MIRYLGKARVWQLLAICFGWLLGGLAPTPRAFAQVTTCAGAQSPVAAKQEADKQIQLAREALERRDFRATLSFLETAYRLYPTPHTLCNLGLYWSNRGRRLEAKDILRRCLGAVSTRGQEPRYDEIERLIAATRVAQGELSVRAEPCAFVRVDGRLVGRTPLSLPLLLSPGRHAIALERAPRRAPPRQVEIQGGQRLTTELELPAAVLLLRGPSGDVDDGQVAALGQTEPAHLVDGASLRAAVSRDPELSRCGLSAPRCQRLAAQLLEAQYVLWYEIARTDPARLRARLLDVEVGAEAAAAESQAAADEIDEELAGLLRRVLRQGRQRPRGLLEVRATPEANLDVDGRRLGRTSVQWPLFSGAHQATVQEPGYVPAQRALRIEPGGLTTLLVALTRLTPPAPPPPPRRPRWRVALGAAGLSLGVGLGVYGALALYTDGQCDAGPDPGRCPPGGRVFDLRAPGAGFLSAGIALVAGGAALWAWPATRKERP